MPNNLTDVGENLALDFLDGKSPTAPVLPLKLALVTAIGTDSAAGTEVSGGSYARQDIVFGTSSAGAASNTAVINFAGMPAATVVGFDVYDSSGTPRRLWWIPAAANKTYAAGDTAQIAVGTVTIGID